MELLVALGQTNGSASVAELAAQLGLHPSTVSRLLGALQAYDFVIQDTRTQRFQLGARCLQLGQVFVSQVEVADVAEPFMREVTLETGLQSHLAVLRSGRVVHVRHVSPEGHVPTQPAAERYAVREVYTEALGKALLAFQPDDVVNAILATVAFQRHTATTITSRARMLAEVRHVRRNGYAVDNGELVDYVRCVAVPIWDHTEDVVAAISVSGSDRQITPGRIEPLATVLRKAADAISARLGARHGGPGSR
jgi:DNA-binding IclR family transcriptional regulator